MNEEKKTTFYERLLVLRPNVEDISATAAAAMAGVSKQAWHDYQHGANPTFATAERIRKGLGLTEGQMRWAVTGFGDIDALKPEGGTPPLIGRRKRKAM